MKRKQITAILLSAIMTVTACVPMNSISAFAAEASGAGNTETAAVVEMQEEEAPAEEAEPDTAVAAQEVQEEQSVEAEPAAEPEESGEEATEAEPAVEDVAEEEEKAEAAVEDASEEEAAAQNEEPAVEAAEEETAEPAAEEAPAAETAVEADDQTAEADQAEAADQKADTAKEAAVVEETTETDKQKDAKKSADSAAAGSENMMDLEVGGSCYVSVSEENPYAYLRITPNETAKYRIYAGDAESGSYDTYGTLYNSDFENIGQSDDVNGSHFQFEEILVAGRTYYVEARLYSLGMGEFYVYLEKTGDAEFYQEGDSNRTINYLPGETVTLSVYAYSPIGEVVYSWTDGDGNELAGNTTEYTYEPTGNEYIYCNATDGSNSCSWVFYLNVSNDLQIQPADSSEYLVEYGASCTLETTVSAKDMSQLTYQWYREVPDGEIENEFELIEGANGASFTIESVVSPYRYRCEVSDQYNGSASVEFHVRINNHFSAFTYADNGGEVYKTDNTSIGVMPNESATLSVTVEADDTEGITYTWYKNYEPIEGANSAEYTTDPVTSYEHYYCSASDQYGNRQDVYFYVYPDNHFNAYAFDNDGEYQKDIYATPNEAVTMSVTVEAADPEGITFSWYKDYELIEGADTAEYTTEPVTGRADYYCHVADKYGNSNDIYFYVYPQNHFQAYTQGYSYTDDGFVYMNKTTDAYLDVTPNEETTLSVTVEADDTEGITYSWYKEDELIEGADTAEYTTEPVTSRDEYHCYVQDKYGNSVNVYFHLRPENHFRAFTYEEREDGDNYPTNSKFMYVTPNEAATLSVTVEADDPDGITYSWYKEDELIEGENSAEYTTEPVTSSVNYECRVHDKYGNGSNVYFSVYPENHFRVYTLDDNGEFELYNKNVYVTPNEAATLSVMVEADDMEGITYEWYENYELIEGADSSVFVTDPIISRKEYRCLVKDKYGNIDGVWFYVYPQNHFRAYTFEEDEFGDTYTTNEKDVYVTPNEEVTLSVTVEADDSDGIIFEWYKGSTPIEGVDSAEYTTDPVTERANYYCRVEDKYGNAGVVDFYVYPENHLRAYSIDDGEEKTHRDIYVTPNEEATLSVKVEADDLEGITYSWFMDSTQIKANSAEYTTDPITGCVHYICEVWDKYGNRQRVSFTVCPENHFKAYPEGEEEFTEKYIKCKPNESVSMKIIVEADDKTDIEYNWDRYVFDPYEGYIYIGAIEDATDQYTITAKERERYDCLVIDKYGNRKSVSFYISIDNGLNVHPEGSDSDSLDVTIQPGETAALKTVVEANDLEGITYRWSKDYEEIEGQNSNILTGISEWGYYRCIVRDAYGNEGEASFKVTIDNDFQLRQEGNSGILNGTRTIYVEPGQEITLKAVATATVTDGITFKWYKGYDLIEGEEGATYTTVCDRNAEYECEARDSYGSYGSVRFKVIINRNFSAFIDNGGELETEITIPNSFELAGRELKVKAFAADMDDIHYQWCISAIDDWYKDVGEDSDSYTITEEDARTGFNNIFCDVYDGYGHECRLRFWAIGQSEFEVDTFSVHPEGAYIYEDGSYSTWTRFYLRPTQNNVTFKVIAAGTGAQGLSYKWEAFDPDEDEFTQIGGNTDSIEVEYSGIEEYRCTVTNEEGESHIAEFYLYKNWIEAYVKGTNDDQKTIELDSPGSVTLEVEAEAIDPNSITYKWYKNDELIPNETGSSLSANVTENAEYHCTATSESHSTDVNFNVQIGTLTASSGNSDFRLDYEDFGWKEYILETASGVSVTLPVIAETTSGGALTYEWVKDDEETISTDSTFTIQATKNTCLSCRVKDSFGNTFTIVHYIRVNHFEAEAEQRNVFYNPDTSDSCILKVIATGDDLSGVSYRWSDGNGTIAEGTDSITVNPGADQSYWCYVEDGFGNEEEVYYDVIAVSGLKALPKDQTIGTYDAENNLVTVKATEGQSVILGVEASYDATTNITYIWRSHDLSDPNADMAKGWKFEDASGDTLSITADKSTRYLCTVVDKYGCSDTLTFDVYTSEIKTLQKAVITLSQDEYTYDGTQKMPAVTVTYQNTELTKGTDYEISYGSNTNAGEGTVTITGLGEFSDSDPVTKTFTINKAQQSLSASDLSVVAGASEKIAVTGAQGELSYESDNTDVVTVENDGTVTAAVDAGGKSTTVKVTAAATENYESATISVAVSVVMQKVPQTISAEDITLEAGSSAKIAVTGAQGALSFVSDNTSVVTVGSDGTVTAAADAGGKSTTVKVTAAATDSYEAATISVTVSVVKKKVPQTISAENITLEAGSSAKIAVTGAQGALSYESDNTDVVTVGSDGTVTAATDAAGKTTTVKVTAAATDDYEAATISVTVSVVKKKAAQTISAENITLEVGSSAKIAVTGAQGALSYVSDNTSVVTVGADGTVTAAAGAAGKSAKITVTAAGTDDYLAGSTTLTVSVKAIDVSPTSANASKLTATASSGLVYNGKEQKPAITVAYNGKALQAGTDYDVKYKEAAHVNAGTYTVYVVCKGNYSGTKEVKYTIAKAAQAPTAAIGGVNAGRTGTFGVVNSFGTVTVASQNTGIATATISGKIVTVKGVAPGTATLSITAAGDGNHTAKTITCSVKVFPAATKTFKAANVTGKGIKLTWAQVAGANGYDIYRNNKKIKSVSGGSTKTYTDTGANTNGSKYTYKIYARAASGTSTLYKSVVIYKLSRPAVKSLSNSAAKKMTVKWAKNAKAKGYQIQYGLKSNFSGAKSTKITSFKTVSKVIGSLTKGKTYYVRIRTYKTVSGKTYYSAWSASKKVKISK